MAIVREVRSSGAPLLSSVSERGADRLGCLRLHRQASEQSPPAQRRPALRASRVSCVHSRGRCSCEQHAGASGRRPAPSRPGPPASSRSNADALPLDECDHDRDGRPGVTRALSSVTGPRSAPLDTAAARARRTAAPPSAASALLPRANDDGRVVLFAACAASSCARSAETTRMSRSAGSNSTTRRSLT